MAAASSCSAPFAGCVALRFLVVCLGGGSPPIQPMSWAPKFTARGCACTRRYFLGAVTAATVARCCRRQGLGALGTVRRCRPAGAAVSACGASPRARCYIGHAPQHLHLVVLLRGP